jgi:hypothetical protein
MPQRKVHARLENWSIQINPFTGNKCMTGAVYGHPRFVDGNIVSTSQLVRRRGTKAYTLNTVYTLGAPAAA